MKEPIKVGFCVAYDWYLLEHSLPLIYDHADVICLSLDRNRVSWAGNKYVFDEVAFRRLIASMDVGEKIMIVEDDFCLPGLTPMQNEVRQRNAIARHLGSGGWHVQLDCDEYFLEFHKFTEYLNNLPERKTRGTNICCPWVVLFKKIDGGFLYIYAEKKEQLEFMQIATKEPHYEYGRRNGNFNVYTNFIIMHESWARPEGEIRKKIYNWGHSNEFDKEAYLSFWRKLDGTNYLEARNFHPLKPEAWPKLAFVGAETVNELICNFDSRMFPRYSNLEMFFKNSLFFSRLRALRQKLVLKN